MISALIISAAIPVATMAQTGGTSPAAPASPATTADRDATATKPMEQASASDAETAGPFVTVPESGAWRVSDLQGKDVYGNENESIGQINDVLVSQNGSVNAVIVGVGGFLGIGEKNVAVDISALQLGPGNMGNDTAAAAPEVSSETTASTNGSAATPNDAAMTPAPQDANSAAAGGTRVQEGTDGLPDRIVLNVTKQQLQDAPQFEGVEAAKQ